MAHILGVHAEIEQGGMQRMETLLLRNHPVIVAVATGEPRTYWNVATSHAVVVVGMDDEFVYVNDPELSAAPHRIPSAEFELAWMEKDYLSAILRLRS